MKKNIGFESNLGVKILKMKILLIINFQKLVEDKIRMSIEVLILSAAWVISGLMLVFFVPTDKFREANVIFLFKQFITWLTGLMVAEFRLIEYPVRLFSYANKTSFTFEYFVYPAICVIFTLHYPTGKSYVRQFMHYFIFCSIITIIEVLCDKYTNIITYVHWTWYLSWLTLFITFYISRRYYMWFFRLKLNQPQNSDSV